MHTIFATNVNDAYRKGMALLAQNGELLPSRNGPVRRMPYPVTTRYERPTERVLFSAQRNANPFFHLFEALWMLAGRSDVETLTQFIPSFQQFSDNGWSLHGAYGYRWRHWTAEYPRVHAGADGLDQLESVIKLLKKNPDDRRVVIGMWDPVRDLGTDSKDIPCNDLIKVMIVHGKLDMQIFCRSNDIVFGAYGANAVHMSFLQEYLAGMIRVPVGAYYQISADYHAYERVPYQWDTYWPLTEPEIDPYQHVNPVSAYPLIADPGIFDEELQDVVNHVTAQNFDAVSTTYANSFFNDVAQPMYQAFRFMQEKSPGASFMAMRLLQTALPRMRNDWLTAGHEWCSRVVSKRMDRAR